MAWGMGKFSSHSKSTGTNFNYCVTFIVTVLWIVKTHTLYKYIKPSIYIKGCSPMGSFGSFGVPESYWYMRNL